MTSIFKSPAEKVTYVGGIINLILSFIKIIGGYLFNSAGLVADGFHSLSDLISDVMVVVVLRISGKKADADHPWGHGRFETLGTAILGAGLIYLGGIIAYSSLMNLLNYESIPIPAYPALFAVIASILVKEWLYHYTLKVGNNINSDLLIANAWHHRSDSLSSIAVLLGLIGAMLGYAWFDALAAILVAAFIIKMGFSFAFKSFKQLVDTALPPEEVKNLTQIAKSVEGVISVHDFKTRGTGSKTILEMHIQVHPFLSASEGHQIGEKVVMKLERRAQEIDIAHVIYHIDTYDDRYEKHSDYANLPLRSTVEPILNESLLTIDLDLKPYRTTLFYHKKKLGIEIMFNESDYLKLKELNWKPSDIASQVQKDLLAQIELENWLHQIRIAWIAEESKSA